MSTRPRAVAGVGSPHALRQANQQRLLRALREDGAASQSELARRTGLSRGTVFNIVRDLERAGVIRLGEGREGGRRRVEVAFSRGAGLAVGVDVDHRHLRVALADLNHDIVEDQMVPLSDGASADDCIALTAELLETALDAVGASHDDVVGVGMCLPAPIDPVSGEVGATAILPGWMRVPAAESLAWRLGLPVTVDNDANLGALAEATWGAARGVNDVVYLKLGDGVGAGLVLGGNVYRGAAGTAGEIGHTTIDERGAVCRCGNRGCLETFVGGEALVSLLRPTYGDELTLFGLVERAIAGEPPCQRVVADAGRHVGTAVANVCNILAPAVVVVGGELAAAGSLLLNPITEAIRRHAIRPAAEKVSVRPAKLGDRAEVLGAVALVLRDSGLWKRPSARVAAQ
ncbi:MAG TPA: ROK family transcriptional regulator [Mycobacteriales bacterium]|nr:ROK family transcriptional regulator [Mycobacteriales bacterium]